MSEKFTYHKTIPQNFTVQILRCGWQTLVNWNYTLHAPYWRFYWNGDCGASLTEENGDRVALVPSNCYIIPPDTVMRSHLDNPVRHFFMPFMMNSLRLRVEPGIHPLAMENRLADTLRIILAQLKAEAQNEASASTLLCCHVLLYEALRHLTPDKLNFAQYDERTSLLIRFLEMNMSSPLRTPDLARRLNMHTNTFLHFFKVATGRTPQQYLTQLRIERAIALLLSTDVGIEQISEETGFIDRFSFSRTFSKFQGCGPATFRRVHRSFGCATSGTALDLAGIRQQRGSVSD